MDVVTKTSRPLVRVAAAALSASLAAPTVSFGAQDPAKNRLNGVKALACTFTLVATGTWNEGEPKADVKPAKLSIAYEAINVEDGTARAIEGSGSLDMIAKQSLWNLHLLWIGSEGAVYLTTVFDRETKGGKLRAVHTRHEYTDISLPGYTSRPEQYYGECEVKK
jgi:hypothetical protein